MGLGECESLAVTLLCQLVDDGASGIGESHDLRALVEGFAGRIVDGCANDFEIGGRINAHNLCMSATHQ